VITAEDPGHRVFLRDLVDGRGERVDKFWKSLIASKAATAPSLALRRILRRICPRLTRRCATRWIPALNPEGGLQGMKQAVEQVRRLGISDLCSTEEGE
jgi:hypothetical protein